MSTRTRILAVALCTALAAVAACGGGPTAPSTSGGTTVAGTVNVNGGGAGPGSAASVLTVTIVGTNVTATVEASGYFQLTNVPSGTIRLLFKDAVVNATAELTDVGGEALIEIQVQLTDSTAVIVNEVRTNEKVSLCHRSDDRYHLINVSTSSEPAHRSHGDGKVGEQVPGDPTKVFSESCQAVGPSVQVEKSTNGEDADRAPGPKVKVGDPVTWQYVVTNNGTVNLMNVAVVDDREGAIACPSTTLAVGASMTCTESGVAAEGQYRNVATVTATSETGGVNVSDTDASHYFGEDEADDEDEEQKVTLCHKTGNGSYHSITVSVSAEPAHRAHGDARPGEDVPGQTGKMFSSGCGVVNKS